jgi:hypothetical protein
MDLFTVIVLGGFLLYVVSAFAEAVGQQKKKERR